MFYLNKIRESVFFNDKIQVNPNKANLASSLAQTTGHLSPNELTGMSLTWQQSIGQRIMRTHSYKFIGQGNPMMGKPGSGLEVCVAQTRKKYINRN